MKEMLSVLAHTLGNEPITPQTSISFNGAKFHIQSVDTHQPFQEINDHYGGGPSYKYFTGPTEITVTLVGYQS